ncbi:MAG TPA: 16S rRNA (cytosine(967)-C(5))-methyltransferase RsmB, partial [Candidatus Atribacteria bacterium]|nr:16S rRNA (cytosine(967)-C(5))-methyltransferase RsmB [Candidatus Atribacteria bacterium]
MESSGTITRQIALKVLIEVNRDGKYANISLKDNLRAFNLTDRDAAFVAQLVYGTLERQLTLDHFLNKFTSMKKANPWIINILRLGAYQILYLDRVPDSAAVNEAVNLCKKHGLFALSGFVNGVLRNIVRSKESLRLPDKSLTRVENMSLVYSFPIWLTEKWIKEYGELTAEHIMRPPQAEDVLSIRANTLKIEPETLAEKLSMRGVQAEKGLYIREALRLKYPGDIEEDPLYKNGYFTIQGESSMLVAYTVAPRPWQTVLDACSSPGGKAIHMAELMGNKGKVYAWDVHEHRVDLVRANAKRMGADSVIPEVMDASRHSPELDEYFDCVLIDAPCSGLGVAHKKPDIKLKVTPHGLEELVRLQERILDSCSRYVKPNGVLVYSTCTINKD